MLSISRCLDVWPMLTYRKTNAENSTAKLANVSYFKGYRLYDPQSKKIRDVRFDEQPEDTVIDCKPEQNTDRLISMDSDDAESDDTDDHEHSDCEQPPKLQESLPQLRCSNRTR